MKIHLVLLIFIGVFFKASLSSSIYGTISPQDYLIGNFDPSLHTDLFLQITSIPTQYPMFFRRDALAQFERLYQDMYLANPSLPPKIPIVSALRNLTYQAGIWNRKWNGEYSNITNPVLRGLGILEYSSMPGTSRHHWGTDLDFYSLSNGAFDQGVGKTIYNWLLKNAAKYGFCQPYTAGRCAGYYEEKWHWSFIPISEKLRADWNSIYGNLPICNWVSKVKFEGSNSVGIMASAYVNTINKNCIQGPNIH